MGGIPAWLLRKAILYMRKVLLLTVDLLGCFELLLGDLDGLTAFLHRTEETGLITFMTSRTNLFHLQQKSISVAIKRDFLHGLNMAAGFAFHPVFLAGTAPEMGFSGGQGALEGGAIHPRHHENAAGGFLLDDGRYESVGVEF